MSLCASHARGFRTCLTEAHGLATAQHSPVHRPLTLHPQPLAPGEPLPLPSPPLPLLPSFPLIPHLPASLGDPLSLRHVLDQCPAGTPVDSEIKDPDSVTLYFIGIEKIGNRSHTRCWQLQVPCSHPAAPRPGGSCPHAALLLIRTRREKPSLRKTAQGGNLQCALCCQLNDKQQTLTTATSTRLDLTFQKTCKGIEDSRHPVFTTVLQQKLGHCCACHAPPGAGNRSTGG